jgi:hypothetical protein
MGKKFRCCSYCDDSDHKDFHGYQIGDDEETPYRKKGKGKKKCKRSKDGEHDFTAKKEGYTWQSYYEYPEKVMKNGVFHMGTPVRKYGYRPVNYITCAKCGKAQRWGWKYGI